MTKSFKTIYKKQDIFSKLAKRSGYRSRSSFKLLEVQEKDKLIKLRSKVLDLGSSPGGWSQVCKKIVGKQGLIFSVDKKLMEPISGIHYLNKSVEELTKEDFEINNQNILPFDVVLSDIAPNISGISDIDNAQMIELLQKVKNCIDDFLNVNGHVLSKVFQGESSDNMMIYMKTNFQKVKIRKPNSSRSNSKETYLLGLGKKT